MAYGVELVIGFNHEKWNLVRKMKVKIPDLELSDDRNLTIPKELYESISNAQRLAFEDMGFEFLRNSNGGWMIYTTPLGQREFTPWNLELYYDPHELGEKPEDAVIGVAISGRYFPTFLDWKNPNGTIDNQVVGPEPPKEIQIAHKRLIEAHSCFEKADWLIKMNHY